MQVMNKGLAGAELNSGGTAYRADEHGVFDVPDSVGELLLTLPGYARPRDTVEKRRAYVAFKKAEAEFKVAENALGEARDALQVAQIQADCGEGTEPGEGAESNGSAAVAKSPAKPRTPAKAATAPGTNVHVSGVTAPVPARTPEALVAKHGGEPTMKWPLEDLRDYARGVGIDAQDDWHKVQVYGEIEAKFNEE